MLVGEVQGNGAAVVAGFAPRAFLDTKEVAGSVVIGNLVVFEVDSGSGVGDVETGIVASVGISGFGDRNVAEVCSDVAGDRDGVFVRCSGGEFTACDGLVCGDFFCGGVGGGSVRVGVHWLVGGITICGWIDVADTIKTQSIIRRRATCYYDDFVVDSQLNRVVKAAISILYRRLEDGERKKRLRNILYIMHDVQEVDPRRMNWHFRFNRNNELYKMLVGISHLVVREMLLSGDDASDKMQKITDNQEPWDLYEHFILEFYRYHYRRLNANPSLVKWNSDNESFLPTMKTDITLTGPEKTLIIDAKYPYKKDVALCED